MNGKNVIVLITVLIIAVVVTACNHSTEQSDSTQNDNITEDNDSEKNEHDQEDLTLTELLPYKKGYTWDYDGAIEYGHKMELKSIEELAEKVIYTVEGEVEDVSGGESKKDFSLDVTYTVTEDRLTQTVYSETMMDNNFSQIELIRLPLSEGNKWVQKQKNSEGEEISLESSIDSIEKDGNQKVYTVTYEASDSEYYEKRKIKEGVGVIAFEHLYINEDDVNQSNMPMGYEINYNSTGFLDSRKDRGKTNKSSTENDEISEEKAIDNVLEYVKEHEDYDEVNAMVDGEEEGALNVRVFENHSDHIATLGWYVVDKKTGEVKSKDL